MGGPGGYGPDPFVGGDEEEGVDLGAEFEGEVEEAEGVVIRGEISS